MLGKVLATIFAGKKTYIFYKTILNPIYCQSCPIHETLCFVCEGLPHAFKGF